jgi:hypothetical protein
MKLSYFQVWLILTVYNLSWELISYIFSDERNGAVSIQKFFKWEITMTSTIICVYALHG